MRRAFAPALILGILALLAACKGGDSARSDSATIELAIVTGDQRAVRSFDTLEHAIVAAREARAEHSDVGLVISIGTGHLSLSEPLVVGPELSGTEAAPTLVTAKPGARPELRASRLIEPAWSKFAGEIWVTPVTGGDFDQLWLNGKRQVLARYPNYDSKILPLGGYASDALSTERAARWSYPQDGVVRAIHRSRWGGVVFRIVGRDDKGVVQLGPGLANNRVSPPLDNQPHERYRFVEGLSEELDAPGEWFFDRRKRLLYVIPGEGVDLSGSTVEVSTSNSIVRIVGTRQNPVHDIVVDGISFSHARDTILEAQEPLLRSDWKIAREGAVYIEGAQRVAVRNSDFHDLGGQAIFVSGYNRDVTISGNAFWDIGGSAISFVGWPSAVRSPTFEYAESLPVDQLDRTPGPLTEDYPAASIATDNLIYNIGTSDKQAAGVEISMSMDITVSYNSIYHVPRAGINIGDGTWGGHVLEHNDVFDTVLESGDHGAFNSWGRDRFWRADREALNASVAAEPSLPLLDVVKPIVLRNNRFQSDHGWDIDLDDGSSNYEIYNNLLLTGGLKLREGFARKVYNNVMVNNTFHPHVWFKDSGDSFERNIIMGPYQPILMPFWSKPIDFNLFSTQAALKQARALGLDARSQAGNALFTDPAQGDYRVADGSPALKLGFENFPLDFGVRSERLRAQARKPAFPELLTDLQSRKGATADFFGATVKSVETPGEQSAAGLPDISGVLVLAVAPDSLAAAADVRQGDVILRMVNAFGETRFGEDAIVKDLADLLSIVQARKWQGNIRFALQRNQKVIEIDVRS